jgi:hypothetical protein
LAGEPGGGTADKIKQLVRAERLGETDLFAAHNMFGGKSKKGTSQPYIDMLSPKPEENPRRILVTWTDLTNGGAYICRQRGRPAAFEGAARSTP